MNEALPVSNRIMKAGLVSVLLGLAFCWFVSAASASDRDRHSGYYYPEPQSVEIYDSPLSPMRSANKRTRIGFTVGLNAQQLKRAFPPGYHIFAKGAEGQKMIIVATGPDRYNTLYRLRSLLAALTAQARTSPLFREASEPENLNFLDLARLTGFVQVTISDGDTFAHRIELQ